MKRPVEIEKLLQWAYREELPKKQTSSAEGIWKRVMDFGNRGGIDPGHGAAQRYPHFGLPHEDAGRIETAVGNLEDRAIDWKQDAEAILGHLIALTEPRNTKPAGRITGWYYADRKPVSVEFEPPRQVIMVRSLRVNALVTTHAKMGTRPDWREEPPIPLPVPAKTGPNAAIVGDCWGKNLYAEGSYCPLRWSPSPIAIAQIRADYLAWWRGLRQLAQSLDLAEHEALAPSAPEMPWRDSETLPTVRTELWPRKMTPLPLKPARKLAGPAEKRRRGGDVRDVKT
jgi:hypothetical protein